MGLGFLPRELGYKDTEQQFFLEDKKRILTLFRASRLYFLILKIMVKKTP